MDAGGTGSCHGDSISPWSEMLRSDAQYYSKVLVSKIGNLLVQLLFVNLSLGVLHLFSNISFGSIYIDMENFKWMLLWIILFYTKIALWREMDEEACLVVFINHLSSSWSVYRFKYLTQVILLVGIMTCIQGILHCVDAGAPNQSPTVLSPLR